MATATCTPEIFATEAAAIRVPVLAAFGERDVSWTMKEEPKAYMSAPSVDVFICPRMVHNHVALGSRVLDVPVGTGKLLPFLHARAAQVFGLDVSPDMIAIAQASADSIGMPAQLGIGDIRQIPFDDDAFDLVTCLRRKLLLGIRYLPEFSDLPGTEHAAVRLAMRTFGVARFLARRSGLVNHYSLPGALPR